MKRISILILLLSVSQLSIAQSEASKSYYGIEAGLDFNSGLTVSLSYEQLSTPNGCSSISDMNGNLLFYSDGNNVWDKTHKLMPNGTGLLGHESSMPSAITVPKTTSKTRYYISTLDEPDPERSNNYNLPIIQQNFLLQNTLT